LVAGRAGLKTYFSFQRVLIVFAIGTLVLTIIVILATSRDSFVSSFDSYVGTFSGEGGSYDKIMAAGGPHGDFSFKASMQAATWPIFGMVFLAISSYWAGESKHGLRSQAIGLGLPLLVGFALLFAVVGAGLSTFGVDFLNALGLADPTEVGLGFAPYYPELAGMSAGPVLGIIMGLGLTAWLVSYIPFLSIIATRSVLAWSFDGIVPSWLSRVDSRGNPVNATIAVYAFAIVILVIYSFTDWLTVTTPLLGLAFVIGLTCVAAIVFPFRRRDLFDGSAGAVRVAGVPLLAIAGVVGVAGIGVQMFILLWDPNSGTNWPADKKQVLATMGAFVVAGGIWVISTLVQRARGIDVANSARTLPVE
jgi:amino acid transporter